jgi:hypothetical protein
VLSTSFVSSEKEEEQIDRKGTRALWKTSRLVLEQSSKT